MPGQTAEATDIFRWLANASGEEMHMIVVGQLGPEHEVGSPSRAGRPRHVEIDRRPTRAELRAVRAAGQRRLDEQWP